MAMQATQRLLKKRRGEPVQNPPEAMPSAMVELQTSRPHKTSEPIMPTPAGTRFEPARAPVVERVTLRRQRTAQV
jgi:hypothetical protein